MPTIEQKRNKGTQTFKWGVLNTLEPKTLPRGAAQSSLNWLTKGDHVELRRGITFIGSASVNAGNGKSSGIKKIVLPTSDIERLFGSYGKKLKYLDESVTPAEWVEIGSDLLGANVVDSDGISSENISIEEYVGLAGNQIFVNSKNISGYYKIMVANPGSYVDMYDVSKNFKGAIKIDTNRTFLWATKKDQTGVYGSYIDNQSYTTVTAEVLGAGTGAQTVFSGTLAFKAGNPLNTAFGISVTDGVETFVDDYNGNLVGSLGGTGTINYMTGAISVTFASAVANLTNVTVSYQHENSNNHGITDFTKSSPRTASQGFVFRQDESGGAMKTIKSYNNVYYCLHIKRSWALTIGIDDTEATNLPYRHKVGIPNDRAAVETGEGVYYVDETDQNDTRVRLLTYDKSGSQQVIPVPISNNLDLNNYTFDQGASFLYGDFVMFSGRLKDSTVNNRTIIYNKLYKSWDIIDVGVTCFDIYNGALVGGDAITNNFLTLFDGLADLDANINNQITFGEDFLDKDGLAKSKKFKMRGDIGPDQAIMLEASIDNGPFVEFRTPADIALDGTDPEDPTRTFHAIEGSGSYVDRNNRVTVGPVTLGRGEIGGGGNGIEAYRYEREFSFPFGKFESVVFRATATRVGWASISLYSFQDVRFKGRKVPRKYRG